MISSFGQTRSNCMVRDTEVADEEKSKLKVSWLFQFNHVDMR